MMIARISALAVLFVAACAGVVACSSDRDPLPGSGADSFGNVADSGAGSAGATGANANANANAGSGSGASDPGGGLGDPSLGPLPRFPGAGTSDAAEPLPNGMLCDAVPGEALPIPEPIQDCFFDPNDPTRVAATLEQVLECAEETDTVHIRLTFHPWFVDNSYGVNAIGWDPVAPVVAGAKPRKGKGGHTFGDLVGSDHAEILFEDATGEVVMQFKLDYLSDDPSAPSGYASLGVTDGEGEMILGDAAHVVRWMTSEDRNLNERGYGEYTVDSPATDDAYTPNASTPEWDYRVVYEAWIALDAFGSAGFGGASIEFVHASPSKAESNTIEVTPGECPPPPCAGSDPDATCADAPPPDEPPPDDSCGGTDPDAVCSDAGLPPDMPGPDCEMFPDQCMVD